MREKLIFLLRRTWANEGWREDTEVVLDWLKSLQDPITPDKLEAAGWRLDIAEAELTLYKRYINDGWYSHVQWWLGDMSVAIGNFDDVIVTFPNCKTMAQLAALVELLTDAD